MPFLLNSSCFIIKRRLLSSLKFISNSISNSNPLTTTLQTVMKMTNLDNSKLEDSIRNFHQEHLEKCMKSTNLQDLLTEMDNLSNNLCSILDLANCLRHLNLDGRLGHDLFNRYYPLLQELDKNRNLYLYLFEIYNKDSNFPLCSSSLYESNPFNQDSEKIYNEKLESRTESESNQEMEMKLNQEMESESETGKSMKFIEIQTLFKSFFNDFESYGAKIQDSSSREKLWERIDELHKLQYKIFKSNQIGLERVKSIHNLLLKRQKYAKSLGFSNYQEFEISQNRQLIKNHDEIMNFLNDLKEKTSLDQSFPKKVPRHLHLDLNNVLNAIWDFFNQEFDIKIIPCPTFSHPKINFFTAKDGNSNKTLGHLYLDLESREGKIGNPSHFLLLSRRENSQNILYNLQNELQVPVVLVSLGKDPNSSTINFTQYLALMHELGHALHSFINKGRFHNISSTRCPLDIAEIASEYMEYIALHTNKIKLAINTEEWKRFIIQDNMAEDKLNLWFSQLDLILHSRSNDSIQSILDITSKIMPSMDPISVITKYGKILAYYGSGFYVYPLAKKIVSNLMQNGNDIELSTTRGKNDFIEAIKMNDFTRLYKKYLKNNSTLD